MNSASDTLVFLDVCFWGDPLDLNLKFRSEKKLYNVMIPAHLRHCFLVLFPHICFFWLQEYQRDNTVQFD